MHNFTFRYALDVVSREIEPFELGEIAKHVGVRQREIVALNREGLQGVGLGEEILGKDSDGVEVENQFHQLIGYRTVDLLRGEKVILDVQNLQSLHPSQNELRQTVVGQVDVAKVLVDEFRFELIDTVVRQRQRFQDGQTIDHR